MAGAPQGVASLGFHVRTGRALAIVLRGPADAPAILFRRELSLWSPELGNKGPYHSVLDLPWLDAMRAAQPVVHQVEAIAGECLKALLEEAAHAGWRVNGAGIVGSMGQDPARIGNPHIRAHAAEGQLFRHAVEVAALASGLRVRSFGPDDVAESAGAERAASIQALGKGVIHPWRSEERCAALAAWLLL